MSKEGTLSYRIPSRAASMFLSSPPLTLVRLRLQVSRRGKRGHVLDGSGLRTFT
jgi:hypothetical protein